MKLLPLILTLHVSFLVKAQVDNPYHLNGNASQESCNCYTLTQDQLYQSGSLWNINKISLNEPFDFKFNLFLGCADGDGADGIAFVLQPISTSIGSDGGGLGYDGVTPSIGVLVDTWQNFEDNDPFEDHIAIHKNGIIDHSPLTDVAQPVTALASGGNIEDCQWHTLRVIWDPVTKLLSTQIDGVDRVSATIDMVAEIFGGNPEVFWGFTAATGGAKNLQKICTSLNPGFSLPTDQTTCFPEAITFIDSSTSFGTIEKWYWDFGDGTTYDQANPPSHTYAQPGNYDVKLSILGNNGCKSEDFVKRIVMGTKPEVKFVYEDPVCEETPVNFLDASTVEFGTIDKWHWTIDGNSYTDPQPPPIIFTGPSGVSLFVETKEGCVSDVVSNNITTYPKPAVDFQNSDVCFGKPAVFTGINLKPAVGINSWTWDFGNGVKRPGSTSQIQYVFPDGGEYNVQLTAVSDDGCLSSPVTKVQKVYKTHAFAGNDTIVATGQTIQLNGSGGELYKWTPAMGLSADNIPNPLATLQHDMQFVLTASTQIGCATTDTIRFKVYDGPALYVPSAFSPNNDGKNDEFKFIAVGMKSVDLFQVFNRYGQLIYSSTEIMKGWDGKVFGITQSAGTYVWMIKGTDLSGLSYFRKGTVTLVR
ncbi:MAG: gliding motility-associated C-terminal domain-containing protein [Chitinophagaceae bacterium]|nr:gliding motility-associated C-terminal domain-containing protein [Chitinophagaceae bacterium]